MLGDLHAGGARELVRLAGDERPERERRVEAAGLSPARGALDDRVHRRRCRRHDGSRRGVADAGHAQGGAGLLHRGRRRRRGIGHGELDGHRRADRLARERFDPAAEAVLHPLQHEPVRRDQPQPPRLVGAGQWPDPGCELLRRQLALEGGKASGPRGRRRHGMHGKSGQ